MWLLHASRLPWPWPPSLMPTRVPRLYLHPLIFFCEEEWEGARKACIPRRRNRRCVNKFLKAERRGYSDGLVPAIFCPTQKSPRIWQGPAHKPEKENPVAGLNSIPDRGFLRIRGGDGPHAVLPLPGGAHHTPSSPAYDGQSGTDGSPRGKWGERRNSWPH